MIYFVPTGENDNEPSLCFTAPAEYSRNCLIDAFGLMEFSRQSLLAFAKAIANPKEEKEDEFTLRQRLYGLLHFETVLGNLQGDEGAAMQWDAMKVARRLHQEQGLESLTELAVGIFRQQEHMEGCMRAENHYGSTLAVEDGLADALLDAYKSPLSTMAEIIDSVGQLELYSREDRLYTWPEAKVEIIEELIAFGKEIMQRDAELPPAPTRPDDNIIGAGRFIKTGPRLPLPKLLD